MTAERDAGAEHDIRAASDAGAEHDIRAASDARAEHDIRAASDARAEHHARVKNLFHDALGRPTAQRPAFLRVACAGDEALLREVSEMLAVEESSSGFLEADALASAPQMFDGAVLTALAPGDQLGSFRILRLLGEGGMGAVYEAAQDRPRRHVALKVLHPGHATERMLRRFELEGEMLARLEHPGIARIYEVGQSDTGRGTQPWLAMELVAGEPLTEHCARRRLPLDARLELLARVCDAVQHAHQRGIVHRDLKPANVLVDASGQPKVLDFGIARATDVERQHATLHTEPGMLVGTLQYMSPEQAAGGSDAIDVRTDVYALGVMLYELVAGHPPFDLRRLPMHEALRRVLEEEPPPLRSTGLHAMGLHARAVRSWTRRSRGPRSPAAEATAPGSPGVGAPNGESAEPPEPPEPLERPTAALRRVPADVAVITHKALAKDKEQRYGSAAELAQDLRRFLRSEPITAQPPSAWYRLRRFTRRNKTLVAGMAATFVALLVGLTLALWQRNEARRALARAEAINRFLLGDLLASPSPERLGRDVRVVDVLRPAAQSAERAFAAEPRVAAEVLDALAGSYLALGLAPEAERAAQRALVLLGEGATDRAALRARGHWVGVLTDLDRAEDAVAFGAAVVADSTRYLGADDPDTLELRARLSLARWDAGQHEQSVAELRAVAATQARVFGRDDARTLATQSQLAVSLAESGAITPARELLATTLARQRDALGPEHPGTLRSQSYLAWILTLGSAFEEALALYAELLPALEHVYGADHPYTALTRVDMAQSCLRVRRMEEAQALVRTACADLERRLGADHGFTLKAQLMLAEVQYRHGEHAAAIAMAAHVVERRRAAGVADGGGENLGHALTTLGRCHQEAGDLPAAAATFREAAQVYRAAFAEPTDYLAQVLYNLGVVLHDDGDVAAAIAPLEEALALDVRLWGAGHRHVVADRYNLARTLLAAGRADDAVTQMRAALTAVEQLDLERVRVLNYLALLGEALLEAHPSSSSSSSSPEPTAAAAALAEAERHLLEAVRGFEQIGRADDAAAQRARRALVRLHERQGRAAEAAPHREERR